MRPLRGLQETRVTWVSTARSYSHELPESIQGVVPGEAPTFASLITSKGSIKYTPEVQRTLLIS